MAKLNSLTIVTFLLFLTLVHVYARPTPTTFHHATPMETSSTKAETDENGCVEDECMMRRSLQAQIDYIYTQNHEIP
ncbi:hypothetical protein CASFOL_004723 [Castilleja foliolosa]|uniref:Phytosulfokine n=1 Tax=Castilleja foliolosa TaxID=1961234 RepID=A0ABD3EC38_9LAMI